MKFYIKSVVFDIENYQKKLVKYTGENRQFEYC